LAREAGLLGRRPVRPFKMQKSHRFARMPRRAETNKDGSYVAKEGLNFYPKVGLYRRESRVNPSQHQLLSGLIKS
jgi:hypothetical protein